MSKKPVDVKLSDILDGTLTQEQVDKADEIEYGERTYAPTLDLVELKLYKLELLEEPREVEGDYGTSRVVEVLNHGDGEKYSLWLPTVLRHKLERCKAGKGFVAGVIYKGVPKGKRYKDFAVFAWTDDVIALLGLKPR
jgi:hypothetical protein